MKGILCTLQRCVARTASEFAIRMDRVSKTFGHIVAVDDLSLTVDPGEVFGFLGPNGAGKSTTIRLLLGLVRPSAGSARVRRPRD